MGNEQSRQRAKILIWAIFGDFRRSKFEPAGGGSGHHTRHLASKRAIMASFVPDGDSDDLVARITRMYETYNAEKLAALPGLLQKYAARSRSHFVLA